MSTPCLDMQPNAGDDLRGDVAEGAGVSTAEMLAAIDDCLRCWRQLANFLGHGPVNEARMSTLRHARAIIAAVAPAICPACGALNIHWLSGGDQTRLPCAACGHRVLPAGHPSPGIVPATQSGSPAALPSPSDGAARDSTVGEGR